MAKTKITPKINFDLSDTEASPVVGRIDGEDVRGKQKVRSMGGRLGFRADTEGMSYGAGVSGGTAKGELDLPSVLEQLGEPDKIKFGSGKIKPQDYDAFLEMADIFGIEGATARVEAGYTPSDYKEDKKRIALKLKYNFAKGGAVPMNNMAKQMEMFDEGGLMDEGGTVDPVSGNDVPPGSTQEEVRDDIPAQLSEGEFVFPADVVRFIGLEKLMKIRQRAKAGLQRMEAMGQMGNSEEAIMPDDLPFSIEDLDMEDEDEYNTPQEFNQGGMPDPNAGVYYNPALQPTTGVAPAPVTAASSNIARSIPIAQAATPMQAGSSNQPAMFNNYPLPQAPVPTMPQRDDLPPFLGGVVPGASSGIDFDEEIYVNDAGQTITFRRYKDGSLKDIKGNVAVIPEGYKIKSEADKDVGTGPVKVKSATVQQEADGDTRDDGLGTSGAKVAWGGTTTGAKQGLKVGSTMVGIGYTKVDPVTGQPITGLGSVPNPKDFASVIGGLTLKGELPSGYAATMTIDNVTTPINNQFFNEAKKAGYMGPSADLSLDIAKTNVQAANIMQAKYGLRPRTVAKTIDDIAKEAASSNVGIAELAKDYGIDVNTIKDNFFGGKNYEDAVAKAVEAANKNNAAGADPFTADDIKAGHAARTGIDAHNKAVAEEAAAKNAAAKSSGSWGNDDSGKDGPSGGDNAGSGGVGPAGGDESSPGAGDANDE